MASTLPCITAAPRSRWTAHQETRPQLTRPQLTRAQRIRTREIRPRLPGLGEPGGGQRPDRLPGFAFRPRGRRGPGGHPGGAEAVVVPLGLAEAHVVRGRFHAGQQRREQLLLGPDQGFPVVVRDLVLVGHGQRPGGAGFHAQPAQDAAQVVDLVDGAVPLAGGVPLLRRVVAAFHVDRVRRAGPGAQLAADALLQPVRPAVELVTAVVTGRGRVLHLGVLDGVNLLEHRPEGGPESFDGAQELRHRSPPSSWPGSRRTPPG